MSLLPVGAGAAEHCWHGVGDQESVGPTLRWRERCCRCGVSRVARLFRRRPRGMPKGRALAVVTHTPGDNGPCDAAAPLDHIDLWGDYSS